MQTLANTIKVIKNIELGRKFPKEVIPYLLKALENADAKTKSEIENQIVKIGRDGIETLVDSLESTKGVARAVAAMALIRLGKNSIDVIKSAYKNKPELSWMVDYIVNEIQGSGKSLSQDNYQEVLVG